MEKRNRQATRRANKCKAATPYGVLIELLQIFSSAFAELLYKLFATRSRMKFVMKDWDVFITISIYKKEVVSCAS